MYSRLTNQAQFAEITEVHRKIFRIATVNNNRKSEQIETPNVRQRSIGSFTVHCRLSIVNCRRGLTDSIQPTVDSVQ